MVVEETPSKDSQNQEFYSELPRIEESSLPFHLENGNTKVESAKMETKHAPVIVPKSPNATESALAASDYQLYTALNVLKVVG